MKRDTIVYMVGEGKLQEAILKKYGMSPDVLAAVILKNMTRKEIEVMVAEMAK